MSHNDSTPAIRRLWSTTDSDVEVVRQIADSVTSHRGLGDSGRLTEIVAHDCPVCPHDRMVRHTRVFPEERDRVEYFCQSPSCPYYLGDELSFLGPTIGHRFPAIWSQTAHCPDCGDKHPVEIDQRSMGPGEAIGVGDEGVVALCKDCQANRAEQRAGV